MSEITAKLTCGSSIYGSKSTFIGTIFDEKWCKKTQKTMSFFVVKRSSMSFFLDIEFFRMVKKVLKSGLRCPFLVIDVLKMSFLKKKGHRKNAKKVLKMTKKRPFWGVFEVFLGVFRDF